MAEKTHRVHGSRRVGWIGWSIGLLVVGLVVAGCGDDPDDVGSDDTSVDSADSSPGGSTSTTGASSPSDLDGRTFVSTEVSGGQQLVAGTEIRLQFADGRLAVDAGCNSMSGPVTVEDGRLEVGEMMSTMMGCDEPLMAQDTWVSAFFAAGLAVTLDGDTLELVGDDGVTIVLAEEVVADASLVGPTWTGESIIEGDTVSSVAGDPPTFTFADDGTVAVFDGCNRGTGGYTVEDDVLTFDPVGLTKMACGDDAARAWSTLVAELLAEPVTYGIDGDLLSLRAADGSGLDLRADG